MRIRFNYRGVTQMILGRARMMRLKLFFAPLNLSLTQEIEEIKDAIAFAIDQEVENRGLHKSEQLANSGVTSRQIKEG